MKNFINDNKEGFNYTYELIAAVPSPRDTVISIFSLRNDRRKGNFFKAYVEKRVNENY